MQSPHPARAGSFLLAMKNPPSNPARDFVPVTLAATAPNFLALHPSVPAKNLNEFIAYYAEQLARVAKLANLQAE